MKSQDNIYKPKEPKDLLNEQLETFISRASDDIQGGPIYCAFKNKSKMIEKCYLMELEVRKRVTPKLIFIIYFPM